MIDYKKILDEHWALHLAPRAIDAPTVISLFAGCGGSSLGYSMAGFRELLAVEFDRHAIEVFKINFPDVPLFQDDIAKLSVEEIQKRTGLSVGQLDVLDGSPPCQGFSTAGKREFADDRNQLFREYCRILKGLRPKVFVMENVSGMVKGKMKLIFWEIMRELKAAGYEVECRLLNAKWFNVPQTRQRVIFIGKRNDLIATIEYPIPAKYTITVREAFENVRGFRKEPKLFPSSEKYYNQLKPGESVGKYHPKGHFFNHVKLDCNTYSHTINKGNGHSRPIHPIEKRLISVSEYARLMSFPDQFELLERDSKYVPPVGNSVPPLMMYAIASTIKARMLANAAPRAKA